MSEREREREREREKRRKKQKNIELGEEKKKILKEMKDENSVRESEYSYQEGKREKKDEEN